MPKENLVQRFGHTTLGHYRDESAMLIGKQLVLDGLRLETPEVQEVVLTTHGSLAAVVSEIKVYPQQSGGWEKKYGPIGSRPTQSALGLDLGMGNVSASAVLDGRGQALAVLSRLLVQKKGKKEPTEMAWNAFLELLGAKKEYRRPFITAMNKMQLDSDESPMRLETVGGVQQWGHTLREDADGHSDLDCTIVLSAESKAALAKLLPGLIG